jgi:heptosyltransferase I
MKILIVKMSSMGDIFHTFPAISDLKTQFPQASIHWVVEEGFKEIVDWHPGVDKVIPISLRRWLKARNGTAWRAFKQWKTALQQEQYDYIVDAQGLLKSAFIAQCAHGKAVHGFHRRCSREAISHWFYDKRYHISKDKHAVERTRQLFGSLFNYTPNKALNFGINQNFTHVIDNPRKLIFIIGTSWVTKLWATPHWQQLATMALTAGFEVEIIWGSQQEQDIAQSIIDQCPGATRPRERMSITDIAEKLVSAAGVVGLDTGFSHLAGALEIPTIAIYGPTSPIKVGLIGEHTLNLHITPALECMPCHKRHCKYLPENSSDTPECMRSISAQTVWQQLQVKIQQNQTPSPQDEGNSL